jgi:hypothetical protein
MNDREKVTIVINDLLKYKTDKDKSKTIDWILKFANTTNQEQTLPIDSVVGQSEQYCECKTPKPFIADELYMCCDNCDREVED